MKVLLISMTALFLSMQANSQTIQEKLDAAKKLMYLYGYQVLDTKYCDLQEGQECYFSRMFYSSNQYVVLAVTEDGVYDLDMYAYDSSGYMYQQDTQWSSVAAISFNKYINDTLTVYVKNVDSYNAWSKYSVYIVLGYKQ